MADYWLSFRIDEDVAGGRTAAQRRDALYDVIDRMSSRWWVDTTSFIIFDSTLPITGVANNCRMVISPVRDTLLIRSVNRQEAVAVGKHESLPTLRHFMNYVDVM